MYNREGCDVARFLVTLQCGSDEQVILKKSASQIKTWQRATFSINKAPGTKCKVRNKILKICTVREEIFAEN